MSAKLIYAFVMSNEDPEYQYAAVADPTKADPGAQAISGINSAAFPEQFAAIQAISQSGRGPAVEQFYEAQYCTPDILALPDDVAVRVVDAEVNEGDGAGIRALQQAVNALLGDLGVPLAEDGILGPLTVAAAGEADTEALVWAFKVYRILGYAKLSLSAQMLIEYIQRASK